jgi:hypothetical protein
MKPRSPTLEGFLAILRRPSFGLAEIAWRWSFGAATGLLLMFSFFEYLDTLPVSKGDLLLLRTTQPVLISRAVMHIFRGSGFRVVETVIVLALTLGVAWTAVASLARAATIKALLAYFREGDTSTPTRRETPWRFHSLFMLNFFRLGATLAAVVGCLAALLLGKAASRPTDPAPGSALLITLTVTMLVWFTWSTLNWFLSLGRRRPVHVRRDRGRSRSLPHSFGIHLCGRDVVWTGSHHRTCSRQLGGRLSFRIRRSPAHGRGPGRRAAGNPPLLRRDRFLVHGTPGGIRGHRRNARRASERRDDAATVTPGGLVSRFRHSFELRSRPNRTNPQRRSSKHLESADKSPCGREPISPRNN